MPKKINKSDLVLIIRKTQNSVGGACGDIEPHVEFYQHVPSKRIIVFRNIGIPDCYEVVEYQGGLGLKEIKKLSYGEAVGILPIQSTGRIEGEKIILDQ